MVDTKANSTFPCYSSSLVERWICGREHVLKQHWRCFSLPLTLALQIIRHQCDYLNIFQAFKLPFSSLPPNFMNKALGLVNNWVSWRSESTGWSHPSVSWSSLHTSTHTHSSYQCVDRRTGDVMRGRNWLAILIRCVDNNNSFCSVQYIMKMFSQLIYVHVCIGFIVTDINEILNSFSTIVTSGFATRGWFL